MQRSRRIASMVAMVAIASIATANVGYAGGLAGSHDSMVRQHEAAVELDYRFVKSSTDVAKLVAAGALEHAAPDDNVELSGVSYPYTRAETWSFVERLAKAYRDATDARLVVTSLTRPTSAQPRNASPLSVHPAGMAVDLRIPSDSAGLAWLEKTLLAMEDAGAIDVTREHHPAHLHIAVFPDAFRAWAAREDSVDAVRAEADAARLRAEAPRHAASVVASEDARSRLTMAVALLAIAAIIGLVAFVGSRRSSAGRLSKVDGRSSVVVG